MHSDFVSADVPVSLLSVALVVFVLEGFQMTRHVAVLQGISVGDHPLLGDACCVSLKCLTVLS